MILLKSDIETIANQDPKILAKWWCSLNSFEWPVELPSPVTQPRTTGRARYNAIMRHIEDRIGTKEISREWNKDRIPGEIFEQWWHSGGGRENVVAIHNVVRGSA